MINRDMLLNALRNVKRYDRNPILSPDGIFASYYGLYNGDVIYHNGVFHAVLRCEMLTENGKRSSAVGHYISRDGYNFKPSPKNPIVYKEGHSIEDPRIFRHRGSFYIASVQVDPKINKQTLHLTRTRDFESFDFLGTLPLREGEPYSDFKGIRSFVPVVDERKEPVKINGNHFAYCYHTLPDGTGVMFCFTIGDINDLRSYSLASEEPAMTPRPGYFDGNLVEPGPTPILTDRSILMVYAGENIYRGEYCAGWVEFDRREPVRIVDRCKKAILTPQEWYETELNLHQRGRVGRGTIFPSGICLAERNLFLYYGGADRNFAVATFGLKQS